MSLRHLVLVLGDQLSVDGAAFGGFDASRDRVLMIEAPGESTHVWSTKPRIAMFLAAMRHFAAAVAARNWPIEYVRLGEHIEGGLAGRLGERSLAGRLGERSLAGRLGERLAALRPEAVVLTEPGEYRVLQDIRAACERAGVPLDLRSDAHFLCSREEFADWAAGYKSLRLEFFYRTLRKRTGVLMEGTEPAGGTWNYDKENRSGFGAKGPGVVPAPPPVQPDAVTRGVFADIETHFPDHPGSLAHFDWPVTRADALVWLDDFVAHRLPSFGRFQDAMWTDTPFGWHARLSAALNLKLLDPREVITAAETAWREGRAPLPSVEGFIRQILGWREFIRGVYWLDMPRLAQDNHFDHQRPLPGWYWTGRTEMKCLSAAIGQTLAHGYAHHIQRLMLTGNFALLAGLLPQAVCDWYLAVYVDAVEWVELPNTAGMALYANGGRFTSKPYAASGAYVKRMSNYCRGCRYRPERREGADACPITALYWHFLDRNEAELAGNPRTTLMVRNLARMTPADRRGVRRAGDAVLARLETL